MKANVVNAKKNVKVKHGGVYLAEEAQGHPPSPLGKK